MAFEFRTGRPGITLTVVAGSGAFGEGVVKRFEEMLGLLPQEAAPAVRLRTSAASTLKDQLLSARSELVQAPVVEKIETAGWSVQGREAGRIEVQHLVVADEGTFGDVAAQLCAVQNEFAVDSVRLVVLCTNATKLLGEWPLPQDVGPSVLLVSPIAASGAIIPETQLTGEVAGTILLHLFPEISDRLIRAGHTVESSGFAGYCGLAGNALERLAQHAAVAITTLQLDAKRVAQGTEREPGLITKFVGEWSPQALGLRLFDPRLVGGLHVTPIPAVPTWADDGTLLIRLDRAAVAVQLPDRTPAGWSASIRKISRTFDMSRTSVWRQQLQQAAAALTWDMVSRVQREFRNAEESLVFAPAWCERALQTLGERASAPRRAMPVHEAGLDEPLAALDSAVAARPNAFVLAGRHALWLAPALVAAATVLHALYPPGRAAIFSVLAAAAGVAVAGAALVRKLAKAHETVIAARDRAIDTVIVRQEAIMSQNAVGYLEDLVGKLREVLHLCEQELGNNRRILSNGLQRLTQAVTTELPGTPPISAVLSQPAEFVCLFEHLDTPTQRWLVEAVNDVKIWAFSEDSENVGSWPERLADWCGRKIARQEDGVKLPSWGELWDVRRKTRQESGLTTVATTLWQRAEPMTDAPRQIETLLWVAPPDLVTELRSATSEAGLEGADVIETRSVPLVCCVRSRSLKVVRRSGL